MADMSLTLDADGVRTESPSDADVARVFESLEDETWILGPGISHIVLQKDATHWLAAFGTFAQGFTLSYQDGEPDREYHAKEQDTSVDKVIGIFQAYARRDDWGQSQRVWETFITRDKTMDIIKRVLVIAVVGYLVIWAAIRLTAK